MAVNCAPTGLQPRSQNALLARTAPPRVLGNGPSLTLGRRARLRSIHGRGAGRTVALPFGKEQAYAGPS